jgi:hypothetical protein
VANDPLLQHDLEFLVARLTTLVERYDAQLPDGSYLATRKSASGELRLEGDAIGLLRLARHALALARGTPGAHQHLDEHSELQRSDFALVLRLVEPPE